VALWRPYATTVTGLPGAADATGDVDLIGKPARPGIDIARTPTEIDAARAVTETGAA
jgi:hypothetical protein